MSYTSEVATLLSTDDVAARTGYTAGRIRVLAAQGRLKGQKVGQTWTFTHQAVAAFMALAREHKIVRGGATKMVLSPAHRPSRKKTEAVA